MKVVEAGAIGRDTVIFPCLAALPTGISWSVFFAQNAGFAQFVGPGLKPVDAMTDLGPAPVLRPGPDPRFYLYVENAGIVGLEKETVSAHLHAACEQLDSCGLITHEAEISSEDELLGW